MNTKSNQVLSIESADFHSTLRDAELERRIYDLMSRGSSKDNPQKKATNSLDMESGVNEIHPLIDTRVYRIWYQTRSNLNDYEVTLLKMEGQLYH